MAPERPAWIIGRLARQVELAAASTDLTLSQYRVLIMLGEGRETASVLADKLAVGRPTVTGVVDGLAQRGLVIRDHDESDRRRITLALSDDGRALLARADGEVERRLNEIAAHCPDGAPVAFAGLEPWQQALDGYRAVRRATRARDAAPDTTADALAPEAPVPA